ncbi:inovirus-type Gp2 protein [Acinetobacter sp. ULE_I010]|uniref:YagK/YfjJ domain-containing protein n=1 Tax=Acinetobacter sp. ULE_I010 TaxID=3373065 RepID=UPI003AF6E6DC
MTMSNDDNNTVNITESSENDSVIIDSVLKQLPDIVRFVQQICDKKIQSVYSRKKIGGYEGQPPLLLKLLSNLPLKEDIELLRVKNEHVEVYCKAYEEILSPIGFEPRYFRNYRANDLIQDPKRGISIIFADLVNHFVGKTYELVNEESFISEQRNRSERSKHQLDRAIEKIDELRENFAKVLVLRLDLGMLKNQTHLVEDIKCFKKYFETYLKKLRSMKVHMIAYIWKLEYGKNKGYHYHTLFFLDGNQHQKDEILGDAFGKAWVEVTQEKGAYYNCNASKHRYKRLGIGMLHHDNQEGFNALKEIAGYFTKVDQFLFLPSSERGKTFGVSQKLASKRKSGRPRRGT